MAHISIAETVGPHHIGLVPDGIALEVAIIVEVKVNLLLYRGVLEKRADAVETGLSERRDTGREEYKETRRQDISPYTREEIVSCRHDLAPL
jgi:hypothetical protein